MKNDLKPKRKLFMAETRAVDIFGSAQNSTVFTKKKIRKPPTRRSPDLWIGAIRLSSRYRGIRRRQIIY